MTSGPLLVWSGEERLATISTNAGSWDHGKWNQGGELKHMFDEDPKTFWHCRQDFLNKTKIIKIEFKQPINFNLVMIRKRMDPKWNCAKRHFNICLVLNEDIENQLCTNTPDGFNNDSSNYITWCKPTKNVKTVELVFRDNQFAHICDLKILYQPA